VQFDEGELRGAVDGDKRILKLDRECQEFRVRAGG
jgi:hypothetical protein